MRRPPILHRRLPVGAEVHHDGAQFRVWAPKRKRVRVVIDGHPVLLAPEENGYYAARVANAKAGARYHYLLDDEDKPYPDPASRYQPDGPHGPSQLVDPTAFAWADQGWKGIAAHGQVLYELHVGTFTREGTFAAAMRELPALKVLCVTCLEIMPVNEFAGRWGWGYDGVDLFAPFHHYGTPDDFRRLVDRCHSLGLGAILDVVYNHLGPDGNYLRAFSDTYFSSTHSTDWGDALNFDGPGSDPVREFFLANALHWIGEYHLDGFRFDATQAIVDNSPDPPGHILSVICRESRALAARSDRSIYIINENEPQHTRLVRPPAQGGYGMDALWNDDFHHSAMAAIIGRNEAYYTDHPGTPQEFISAAKYGYLYQGQRYAWQKKRRGTPAYDLPPTAFVHFLQNHDQVANSGTGRRACDLTSPGELRAMTALLLLMPQTPMLFQGQEYAANNPFFYFADHNEDLARLIRAGRAREVSQFPSVASAEMQSQLTDPGAEETFNRCKLDHAERNDLPHRRIWDLHKDLLALRRTDATFSRVATRCDVDGAVLGPQAFCLRFFGHQHGQCARAATDPAVARASRPCAGTSNDDTPFSFANDRLLLVNLGRDFPLVPCPEPLLAPPQDHRWRILLSTESPQYGGGGTPHPDTEREGWHLPGRSAIVLAPAPAHTASVDTRTRTEGSAQSAKLKESNLSP